MDSASHTHCDTSVTHPGYNRASSTGAKRLSSPWATKLAFPSNVSSVRSESHLPGVSHMVPTPSSRLVTIASDEATDERNRPSRGTTGGVWPDFPASSPPSSPAPASSSSLTLGPSSWSATLASVVPFGSSSTLSNNGLRLRPSPDLRHEHTTQRTASVTCACAALAKQRDTHFRSMATRVEDLDLWLGVHTERFRSSDGVEAEPPALDLGMPWCCRPSPVTSVGAELTRPRDCPFAGDCRISLSPGGLCSPVGVTYLHAHTSRPRAHNAKGQAPAR